MIPYTGAKLITDPIHWEVFNSALGAPGSEFEDRRRLCPAG